MAVSGSKLTAFRWSKHLIPKETCVLFFPPASLPTVLDTPKDRHLKSSLSYITAARWHVNTAILHELPHDWKEFSPQEFLSRTIQRLMWSILNAVLEMDDQPSIWVGEVPEHPSHRNHWQRPDSNPATESPADHNWCLPGPSPPVCKHIYGISTGGPGKAFQDLARIIVGFVLFLLPDSVSIAETWARAGVRGTRVEWDMRVRGVLYLWIQPALVLKVGSAIYPGWTLEQAAFPLLRLPFLTCKVTHRDVLRFKWLGM